MLQEDRVELRQELRIIVRMHDDVVDEWRCIEAFEIFAQQARSSRGGWSSIWPIQSRSCAILVVTAMPSSDTRAVCAFSSASSCSVFCKFRHEDELGNAARQRHPHLGDEGEAELDHLHEAELRNDLRDEAHRELEGLVVVATRSSRGRIAARDARSRASISMSERKTTSIARCAFSLHESELRLCHDRERALRADDELREVEGAFLVVHHVPERVACGILGHVSGARLRSLSRSRSRSVCILR